MTDQAPVDGETAFSQPTMRDNAAFLALDAVPMCLRGRWYVRLCGWYWGRRWAQIRQTPAPASGEAGQ